MAKQAVLRASVIMIMIAAAAVGWLR